MKKILKAIAIIFGIRGCMGTNYIAGYGPVLCRHTAWWHSKQRIPIDGSPDCTPCFAEDCNCMRFK